MLDWKKEKFGQFKNKSQSVEDRQGVRRKYFVFHVKPSGQRGMHLGHMYAESQYQAELHANHFFAFMGKPLLITKKF